jgi:sugar phosphate isomerase/epimerase
MRFEVRAPGLQLVRKALYHRAIEIGGRLGFDGIEFTTIDSGEPFDYHNMSSVRGSRCAAISHKLVMTRLGIYYTVCEGTERLDSVVKAGAVEAFARGFDVCRDLGCGIVNVVLRWTIGMRAAIEFVPFFSLARSRGGSTRYLHSTSR